MYNIIVNMYSGTQSCISYNDCKSEFFPCNNGVRQGDNLYPFLFAVFMNDLESYNENLRFLGSLPLEKTITFLLSVFTLSFQIEQ
jgi:hypothetical protein